MQKLQPSTMDMLLALRVMWQWWAKGRTLSSSWVLVFSATESPKFSNVYGMGKLNPAS